MRGKRGVLTEHTGVGLPSAYGIRMLLWLCTNTIGRCNIWLANSIICLNKGFIQNVRRIRLSADVHLLLNTPEHDWLPAGDDPVSAQDKQKARIYLGLPVERPVVLFIGRVLAIKGVDLLLNAYDATYELVFCGPCSPSMRKAIEDAGARYYPPQVQSMLLAFYQAADLMILPSRSEGQSLVVYEALCCGCDVLLGEYPGSEFYANCRGVHYCALTLDSLRSRIKQLLGSVSQDADNAGRVHVRSLFPTKEQWVSAMLALLQGKQVQKPRLLFVAFQNSVHTARWLQCVAELGWDIHVFATTPWPVHELLTDATVHYPFRWPRWLWKWPRVRIRNGFSPPLISLVQETINRLWRYRGAREHINFPGMQGPVQLNRLIRKLKPELIHSLEFQHCGYLVLEAKRLYGDDFPAWATSSWEIDISYFRHDESHLSIIQSILGQADYYIADCERDLKLVHALRWGSKTTLVALGFAGIAIKPWQLLRSRTKPSERRQIMVKGYQNLVGRALTALRAVEQCADILHDMEIVLFLASNSEVQAYAKKLQKQYGLHIRILLPLLRDGWMKEFAKSRVILSISAGDGVPATLLESMVMGAFPIQTNTAAVDEWLNDGEGGFIVPVDNVSIISACLRRALTDDDLVDNAAVVNWITAMQKIDWSVTSPKILSFYRDIMAQKEMHS
jgi:glycosyltransferase involved in cell wall biosynthesis